MTFPDSHIAATKQLKSAEIAHFCVRLDSKRGTWFHVLLSHRSLRVEGGSASTRPFKPARTVIPERRPRHMVEPLAGDEGSHNYVFEPTILNPLLPGYHSLLAWLHNRPIEENQQMGKLKSGVRDMFHSGNGNLSVCFPAREASPFVRIPKNM